MPLFLRRDGGGDDALRRRGDTETYIYRHTYREGEGGETHRYTAHIEGGWGSDTIT